MLKLVNSARDDSGEFVILRSIHLVWGVVCGIFHSWSLVNIGATCGEAVWRLNLIEKSQADCVPS